MSLYPKIPPLKQWSIKFIKKKNCYYIDIIYTYKLFNILLGQKNHCTTNGGIIYISYY